MTRRGFASRAALGAVAVLLVALFSSSLFAGHASAAPAKQPMLYGDISTSNDTVLVVNTYCDFKVLDPKSAAPFDILVKDRRGISVEGAVVTIQLFGPGAVNVRRAVTDRDGMASFYFTSGRVERQSETWVVIWAEKEGYIKGYDNLRMTTVLPEAILSESNFWYAGVGILGFAAFLSTEGARYGMAKLLFPLYTRLKKEEVLDHFVRGQIYGYIVSNPGNHYSMIKDALSVNNGTLSHHLRTLECQGFIKSKRDGAFRRFYPVKMTVPQDDGTRLSDLQLGMLDIIRQTGSEGATQRFISDMLDASQQTVSYNLRVLDRHGAVRVEHDGRRAKYFIQNT